MAIERDDRQLQQQQQLQRGHVRLAKIYEREKSLWDWANGKWEWKGNRCAAGKATLGGLWLIMRRLLYSLFPFLIKMQLCFPFFLIFFSFSFFSCCQWVTAMPATTTTTVVTIVAPISATSAFGPAKWWWAMAMYQQQQLQLGSCNRMANIIVICHHVRQPSRPSRRQAAAMPPCRHRRWV